MYKNGKLITSGERKRIHSGVFGVNKYVPERCEQGFTLFSPAYGYTEYLIDMRGLVIHTWPVNHTDVAELLPNGNLLTHNDGRSMEEVAPDGSLVWRWEGHEGLEMPTHHDFYNVNGKEVVLLARKQEPVVGGIYPKGEEPDCMRTDLVLRIDRSGEILWEFSFSDHIDELSQLSGLPLPIPYAWAGIDGKIEPRYPSDWAHTNTVEVLPPTPLGEKDSRFGSGNVLVSFRALDTIAIIDPDKDALVWCYGLGILDGQHQPTMLPNGNILLFDNGTYRGFSVVREIHPPTGEIVWEYSNGADFFSPFRSGAQRLGNGNTLICECDAGHLFEVTNEGDTVWDYYSPFVGQGREHLGKRIHRATRYPPSYVEPLLDSRKDRIIGEVDAEGERIQTYKDLVKLYQS
jgi:hypothetical protein